MVVDYLVQGLRRACASLLVDLSAQELAWLLRARAHISLMVVRRAQVIVTRARLVAGLFAVLTPLWIVIDLLVFPAPIWQPLALARIVSTLAFTPLLRARQACQSNRDAQRALILLLAVPTLFFVFSHLYVTSFDLNAVQAAFAAGYTFLPFVMLAGLSIFPLTLAESMGLAAPMLLASLGTAAVRWQMLDWPTFVASFWLMLLITAVSAIAGLSQLAFMIVLVRDAIHDGMTGCFSRQSGEELLDLQFVLSCRMRTPLSLAFIDLDHFKQVNDQFGHDAGDRVLVQAAAAVRCQLRAGDMLMRWGGEEFVLVMPNIGIEQALQALSRVAGQGFGRRPDGTPITASVGVAERLSDGVDGWKEMVELADARMYEVKRRGRNGVYAGDRQSILVNDLRRAVQPA